MARDVSIVISVRDNFTQAITTMRNASQAFDKDITGLQSRLDDLNKSKITLKVDTDKAKTALREAEKQFAATGFAADKLNLELANANYKTARSNLDLVSKNAKQAEKDILSLTGAASKAENKAGSGTKNLLSGLAAAGALNLLGDTAANIASGFVSSAYGSEGSTIFSNILSGAASGAAVGTTIGGPGVGTAIGAGIGLVNGLFDVNESKSEAFKAVVRDFYENAKQMQRESLISGSAIAGSREQKQLLFARRLGSDEAAAEYLAQMTEFAATTTFEYDQLAELSKNLLDFGYKADELLPLLTKVEDAGAVLGMSSEDMKDVAFYLKDLQDAEKATVEYLDPFLKKQIPVWEYLAQASEKTSAEVQEMVSKGLIPGEEAAEAIAKYMGADFAGGMVKELQTYPGRLSALQKARDEIDAAKGEGYNEEHEKGMQAEIDWLRGESGEKLKEAKRMIGKGEAFLENEREEAIRNAKDEMLLNSVEYQQAFAEGNWAKVKALLAEAEIKGENEFKGSKVFQRQLKADKELAERIRKDTSSEDERWHGDWLMTQQFSKGPIPTSKSLGGQLWDAKQAYVSYDSFPALLYQDEKVSAASEARSANSTNGRAEVLVTGNNFTVREEADIEKIAREICSLMKIAAMLAI
ncbi:MAG: tape measure protein [Peptococcaceae bacterium]